MTVANDASVYRFSSGDSPLLISVPHDGRLIPDKIAAAMTAAGRAIPDTDWHVARLYEFAHDFGANMLVANYSRYVVDLNRSAGDEVLYPGQVATGLCPTATFAGDEIYSNSDVPDDNEKQDRVERYWQPYHDCLNATLLRIKQRFGFALLWDAHSIPGNVPRLFDGELPVLNIGSNEGRSTLLEVASAVYDVANKSPYDGVLDGRFKGGYITRHYGAPEQCVHALQLEIAQRAYMDEKSLQWSSTRAASLRTTIRQMIEQFQESAARLSHGSGSGQ